MCSPEFIGYLSCQSIFPIGPIRKSDEAPEDGETRKSAAWQSFGYAIAPGEWFPQQKPARQDGQRFPCNQEPVRPAGSTHAATSANSAPRPPAPRQTSPPRAD